MGGGKRKLEEERAERKGEVAAEAAAGVGVGLGRRGGASSHALRPGGGPALRRTSGGGEGWLASGSRSSRLGRCFLAYSPPPPPSRRSVNPSPRRWAVRATSGFLGANHPPRAQSPGRPPAAAIIAPLSSATEGRLVRVDRRDSLLGIVSKTCVKGARAAPSPHTLSPT